MESTSAAPVVVGVDGSAASRAALEWAHAEARRHNAPLEVVHAWHEPFLRTPSGYPAHLVGAGRINDAALHMVRDELRSVGLHEGSDDSTVIITTSQGSPGSVLVRASRRAVLVAVGRQGTGGAHLLGGVAEQVAHHAACPVAVVPIERAHGGRGIIVGVDGSPSSIDALRWASHERLRRHTEVTAVLAWSWLDQTNREHEGDAPEFDPHYSMADGKLQLDHWLHAALGDAARHVHQRVVNDLPAPALLDATEGAELIVVGSRGMGGFRGLLLGAVSRRIIDHSACPAVVVRHG